MDTSYSPDCSSKTWSKLSGELPNSSNVSLLSVNIRGLSGKFNELKAHLNLLKIKFTFILITETLLKAGNDGTFGIDGYKSISLSRSTSFARGLKFYIRDSISFNKMEDLTKTSRICEQPFVSASLPGIGEVKIGGIYRSPNSSKSEFLCNMEGNLRKLNGSKSILIGDFNFNTHSALTCGIVREYIELFSQYNYTNEINLSTYVSSSTNDDISCLDHIWSNVNWPCRSFVIGPNISDHYATAAVFNKEITRVVRKIKFRVHTDASLRYFQENLESEFERYNPPSGECNSHAVYTNAFLSKLQNKYFPIKTKTVTSKRLNAPWLTRAIVKCIQKKHRWWRLLKDKRITKESYKLYTAKLRKLLRDAEEDYFRRKFNSLKNDQKKNWKVLNWLLGRREHTSNKKFIINGDTTEDETLINNAFCKHFIEKPIRINSSIPPEGTDFMGLVPNCNLTCNISPSSSDEVCKVIKSLKKNGNVKDLTRKFLVAGGVILSKSISDLFNACVQQGKFPNLLKEAKITPIYKKGQKNLIDNYRPISVLGNVSKVFEMLIYNRLKMFFHSNGILNENQFGYRQNRSTELAGLCLFSKILDAINRKDFVICVFLDYSACFDTVCRAKLLFKLRRYGLRGKSLHMIKSYFENRLQSVGDSEKMVQDLGVVQGSRTGPLLFDVYTNDFNSLFSNNENVLYADDTGLVFSGTSLNELIDQVNQKLNLVYKWCNFNKLSLNLSKCEYMFIGNREETFPIPIKIGSAQIKGVQTFKYLGVYIDRNMRFGTHIAKLKTKLSQICGVAFRLRRYFNKRAALNMYYSCVYSTLSYCIGMWGGALLCTSIGEKLCRVQNKIVHNLLGRLISNGECPFKVFRILKLVDIYKLRVAVYMYQVIRLNEHPTLRRDLNVQYPQHAYNTRFSGLPQLPAPRIETYRMNFKYQFVKIWNEIAPGTQTSSSLRIFKKKWLDDCFQSY